MNLRLVKNINYMVVAQAANYAMPLLLVPYLVQTLGLVGFGDFSIAQSVINVGLIAVQFGFNIFVTKEIAEKNKHGQPIETIISTALVSQLAVAVPLVLAASAVYAVNPVRVAQLSFWYSFSWLGQALFPVWYFQGTQSFKQLAGLNVALRSSTFLLVFVLIEKEEHLLLLPMIYSFSYVSTGLYACAVMWRGHKLCVPTLHDLRTLAKNTKDLFVSNIASVSIMNMPVFFLGHLVEKEEVGAFSAILRVTYAVKGILNAGFQVLLPVLVCERERSDYRGVVWKVLLILLAIVGAALLMREPFQTVLYGRQAYPIYDLEYLILFVSIIPGVLATLLLFVFAMTQGKFTQRKNAFILVFVLAALLYFPFIHLWNGLGAALVILISETTLLLAGVRVVSNKTHVCERTR